MAGRKVGFFLSAMLPILLATACQPRSAWQGDFYGLRIDAVPHARASNKYQPIEGSPSFPWQTATGLRTGESAPALNIILLKTSCPLIPPPMFVPQSIEGRLQEARAYLRTPRMFGSDKALPDCRAENRWLNRWLGLTYLGGQIGPADMYHYAAASLRWTEKRLGPPDHIDYWSMATEAELRELGIPTMRLTARWTIPQDGRKVTIAAFSASASAICMALFSPDLQIPDERTQALPDFACLRPFENDGWSNPSAALERVRLGKPKEHPRLGSPRPTQKQFLFDRDYPRAAQDHPTGVSVGMNYTVSPDGHVMSCTVPISSGDPILDAATCRLFTARARFEKLPQGGVGHWLQFWGRSHSGLIN
jgi:TonB family protein